MNFQLGTKVLGNFRNYFDIFRHFQGPGKILILYILIIPVCQMLIIS